MKVIITFLTVVLVSMGIYAGVANAHPPSQGSQGFSQWKAVTWNDSYVVVRHQHRWNGTICEALKSNENRSEVERFRLLAKNAGNKDCVPDDGQG